MIDYEGYIYNLERKTKAKMIFRCHTDTTMGVIVSGPTDHCHAPNIDRATVLELKNQIKSKAADSGEPTSTILHRAMCSFPLDSASQLPQHDTLLRTIRRQRQAPSATSDTTIPDQSRQTDHSENFVLYEDKKLIIVMMTSNLSVLKSCEHWFANGTLKVR